MIRRGDRIVAAVSGGPDSTAMLDLLASEAAPMGFSLAVAHLDHMLRGEASEADGLFVRGMASSLGLEVFCGREDVRALARREKRSVEEAGRIARSRFLERVAASWGASSVALGHHRDDLAEGILMRILQGSGVSGLAAIRPVVAGAGAQIIRPLIAASRRQIMEHLQARSLPFRTDETNEDPSYLRNRVRSRLLPLLEAEFNPKVAEALCRCADLLREEDAYMATVGAEWLERNAGRPPHRSAGMDLPAEPLLSLPLALRRRVVREALLRCGASPRRLRFDQIQQILEGLERRRTGARVVIADGYVADLERGHLVLSRRGSAVPPPAAEAQVVIPGRTPIPWGGGAIVTRTISREGLSEPLSAGSGPLAHLDFDRTGPALALRRRRPGDRFHPLGAPGSRKLSDFFCDMHLPASLRDGVPLLVAAQPAGSDRAAPDPAGEIAWVVGSRISERFKVTPATRRILRVSQEAGPAE